MSNQGFNEYGEIIRNLPHANSELHSQPRRMPNEFNGTKIWKWLFPFIIVVAILFFFFKYNNSGYVESNSYGDIIGDEVTLRSSPSIEGSKIDFLYKMSQVEILDSTINANENYILTRDASVYLMNDNVITIERNKSVNIFQSDPVKPLISFKIEGKDYIGEIDKANIKKINQLWYEVKSNQGKIGWVNGDLLKKID